MAAAAYILTGCPFGKHRFLRGPPPRWGNINDYTQGGIPPKGASGDPRVVLVVGMLVPLTAKFPDRIQRMYSTCVRLEYI